MLVADEEVAHQHATEVFRTLGQTLATPIDREVHVRDDARTWLEIAMMEKEPATDRHYRDTLDRHLLPALGHLKLREVQRGRMKVFLATKRAEGHSKNGVRQMKAALSVMLSDAADDGIIAANPALQLGGRSSTTFWISRRSRPGEWNWRRPTSIYRPPSRMP